ncbi:MAG: hypothetical protein CML34_01920 [Rhodobacteraceae bacterium]|nr:hypothetical protein [Paracoccaceae bacterium]MBV03218.1 hypothetical protein [Paracoccaceae bacterium]
MDRLFKFSLAIILIVISSCTSLNNNLMNASNSRSFESIQLEKYYNRTSQRLRARGLLRTDKGRLDSLYSTQNLIENFEKIALYNEYIIKNNEFIPQEKESNLKRWNRAIKINIIHGENSSNKQIKIDKKNISIFTRRLASITGLEMSISEVNANFIILFLDLDERRDFGQKLSQLMPQLTPAMIKTITSSPRSTFCSAFSLSEPPKNYEYTAALVLIKSEHSKVMRKSCIHEEMAQSLGLTNDSKSARPSIFNDDEEFALLTRHDELLLKILYDKRLKPGMNNKIALPIVRQIAEELMDL